MNKTSNLPQNPPLQQTAVSGSALTPMHKMIIFLCETGNYDLVDKANELLIEERKVIENAHLHGVIHKFDDPTIASEEYYKSRFALNTSF